MSDVDVKELTDKVHKIEIQLERIVSHMESEIGTAHRLHDDFKQIIQRYDKIIFGNGNKGLNERVNNLEAAESKREKNLYAVWVAICGIVTKVIYDLFKH